MLEDDEYKVVVINDREEHRGVSRYSRDLFSAIGKNAILVNVRYSSMPPLGNGGEEFRSSLCNLETGTRWDKLLLVLDSFAYPLTLGKVKSYMRKMVNSGYRIHYSSQMIPPISGSVGGVVTIHDLVSYNGLDDYGIFLHSYFKKLVKYYSDFENIVVDSKVIRDGLISIGSRSDPVVIYPCASKSFFRLQDRTAIRQSLRLPLDKTLILSMGATSLRKNVKIIPEVMQRLGENFQLVRIGDHIKGALTFNNLDEETINKVYNACDILIHPALEEGFGYAELEGFAVGLPTVVSDIPVMREICEEASVFCDPNSPIDFARGVKEAKDQQDLLISRGLRRASFFSFDQFKRRIRTYYKSLW